MSETFGLKANSLLPTFTNEEGKVLFFKEEKYPEILNMIKYNIFSTYEIGGYNEERLKQVNLENTFDPFKPFKTPILIESNI